MRFTKCPPGEALGARDLQTWSKRRAIGRSGTGWEDDKWVDQFTKRLRTIKCKCGHRKTLSISDAKMKRARFRCSKCGMRLSNLMLRTR